MVRSRKILYHILFWAGVYLLWILLFRSYSVAITRTMTIEFCYLLFITADYYAIHSFAIPRLLGRKRYSLFVLAVVLVIAVSAGLRAWVALFMSRYYFVMGGQIDYGALYLRSFFNISLWVLAVTLGRMLVERMQTEQQLEVLEKERIRSELDYLKAQINPHALFNSLNTIYGHIDKHNQVARNILLQFSELLRYQLYDCAADKVSLQKEIAYIENYVAFQRLRKDERLVVNFKVGNIGQGLRVAPLMLVVLIENAFKFVSNFSDRPNKICIEIYTKGSVLYTNYFNTREPQAGDGVEVAVFAGGKGTASGGGTVAASGGGTVAAAKGIGIANLRRRLELLYNHKYELSVNSDYDCYETSLTIDLS
jgi:two-component system LytT family sensor kinase